MHADNPADFRMGENHQCLFVLCSFPARSIYKSVVIWYDTHQSGLQTLDSSDGHVQSV